MCGSGAVREAKRRQTLSNTSPCLPHAREMRPSIDQNRGTARLRQGDQVRPCLADCLDDTNSKSCEKKDEELAYTKYKREYKIV